jgi:heme a synthase
MTEQLVDWRRVLPERRRRFVRAWYWVIAALTFCVLIVGGATRLTHSGLSMVEWQPILGIIPPITSEQWEYRFQQYKQFPEYQKLRQGMTMGEFQLIYYWEYLHRLLARAIGVVFLLPFLFFLLKRWLTKPLVLRSLALFGLGAMQGVMGWLMVASGLVDRPSVSHYRLAAHLSLAFLIFGYAVWLARELDDTDTPMVPTTTKLPLKRGLAIVGGLLALQILWGAFVAGLKAGSFANTFPLMGGRLLPTTLWDRSPALLNIVENPVTVQWLHRVIGTVLGLAIIAFVGWVLQAPLDRTTRRLALALLLLTTVQYVLGVFTLLNAVPVLLGVTHQAMAMILFATWLIMLHHSRQLRGA